MRYSFSRRSPFLSASGTSGLATSLLTPLAALAMLFAANCGGGGNQSNPPPPDVVVDANAEFVDVGERFELDASQTTDEDGDFEDIEFQWRFTRAGTDTEFDDHCRADFDQICTSNDDDHCSNDTTDFCDEDSDCPTFGTCLLNSGTSSPDCDTGICGLGEGDEGAKATFVADVAGPFTVRLTAIGSKANGTETITLNTYPSLFLVDGLFEFGGTEGALVGQVADAEEFAEGAVQGASNPVNGDLVVIDNSLGLVRVFDLRGGNIIGQFGESDSLVDDPAALAFHPQDDRLYIAEAGGRVLIFDASTGLLISTFGDVGANPLAIAFTPDGDQLLVVDGTAGVQVFDADGSSDGVLGETGTTTDQAVDLAFLGNDLLIADRTGKVVRCDGDGTNCGAFSDDLDDMLAANSPIAIAVNPSADHSAADVLVADPQGTRVIACNASGGNCETFGDTEDQDSSYSDVFFAPTSLPTTTTLEP